MLASSDCCDYREEKPLALTRVRVNRLVPSADPSHEPKGLRRKDPMRKLLLAAAMLGGFLIAVPAQAATAAPTPDAGAQVAAASGSPPKALVLTAAAPKLPTYTIVSGDTLWALGLRFGRTWSALASWNHIPNPNLIYVGNVLTIPPASFNTPAPVIPSTPVHSQYNYAPMKQQVSTPVLHSRTSYVAPTAPSGGGSGGYTGIWACIAQHESGGNVHINTGNGYYGGLQFTAQTWAAYGGQGSAADASAAEQMAVANRVVAANGGYGAWPNTSRMCGV